MRFTFVTLSQLLNYFRNFYNAYKNEKYKGGIDLNDSINYEKYNKIYSQ